MPTEPCTSRQIIGAIVGVALIIGAGAAWHYWQVDGFLAFIIAAGWFAILSRSLGLDLDLL